MEGKGKCENWSAEWTLQIARVEFSLCIQFTWLFRNARPLNDNTQYGCMQSKNGNKRKRVFPFVHLFWCSQWYIEAFEYVTNRMVAAAVQCSSCVQTPSLWMRAITYSSRTNPSNHPLEYIHVYTFLNIKVSLGFTQNVSRHQLNRFSLSSSLSIFLCYILQAK